MSENYTRSRKLASFEYMGRTFHIVRRKFNGKTWRQYCTIIHEGAECTPTFPPSYIDPTNANQCASYWLDCMKRLFRNEDSLGAGLACIKRQSA